MKSRLSIILLVFLLALVPAWAQQRRRASAVTTAAAETQPVNETAGDTARFNAQMRKRPNTYINDSGFKVYVDTASGDEWIDSSAVRSIPKMEFPLFHALAVGVNIWDPVMRAFGQKYGIADAWVELSLHNRYKPIVEVGLGTANSTPAAMNFTYRSPLSVYFRLGANYNFLYNSNPDYYFYAGLRYGFSPFSYSVDNVTLRPGYWGEGASFDIPAQHAIVGWVEVVGGVRVKIWGPVSAGWTIRYKSIIHRSHCDYGDPWYVPGFGAPGAVSGSFSISYTLSLSKLNKPKDDAVIDDDAGLSVPAPSTLDNNITH